MSKKIPDGTKIVQTNALQKRYTDWLTEKVKKHSQESIESFAIEVTRGNTERHFGMNELDVIYALGGKKPFMYD